MLVCGRDLVCRVADFERDEVETAVSLRPWQWDILFALDGRTPLADIARGVGIDMEIASEALRSLHEQGLIVVRSVRIDEYRQSVAPFALPMAPKAQAASDEGAASMVPQAESVPAPASAGIAFSLKAPSVGIAPVGNSTPSHGSIGFKIK